MITRIDTIVKFGYFENAPWHSDADDFSLVNIIYGYNGSGKTTLSNLFTALSSRCKQREEFIKEIVSDMTEVEFTVAGKKSKLNSKKQPALNIYVFNAKFVNDHIFDGSKTNVDSFSESAVLTNEPISRIDGRIQTLLKRKDILSGWIQQCEKLIIRLHSEQSEQFGRTVSNKRLAKPKALEEPILSGNSIDELRIVYQRKLNEDKHRASLQFINSKADALEPLNLAIEDIQLQLVTNIEEEARQKLGARIAELEQALEDNFGRKESLNEWYQTGSSLLKVSEDSARCPLCWSDISSTINQLLSEYSAYFSEAATRLNEL